MTWSFLFLDFLLSNEYPENDLSPSKTSLRKREKDYISVECRYERLNMKNRFVFNQYIVTMPDELKFCNLPPLRTTKDG